MAVRLTGDVPAGVPEYVANRADLADRREAGEQVPPVPTGQQRLYVSLFLTPGARVDRVTVDGAAVPFESDVEQGHPVVSVYVLVDPGAAVEVAAEGDEPLALGPAEVPGPAARAGAGAAGGRPRLRRPAA